MRIRASSVVGLGLWLAFAVAAWTQEKPPAGLQRSSSAVKQSLASLSSPLEHSVVEIRLADRTVALGTIVGARGAEGIVVTKASELGDGVGLICRLWDDRKLTPEIVAKDESLDLALLRFSAENLQAVDLSSDRRPTAGSFLVSVGTEGQTLGLGMAEVDSRKFELRQPQPSERGYLGVNCNPDAERGGLVVQQVTEDSAARRAGIRKGDVIVSINERQLSQVDQLVRELREHKAGDNVDLVIRRGEEQMALQAKLGVQALFEPYDQWGGGPFSKRRFGFDSVIVHDTPIAPQHCGGPVLDTDGRVVGINIARALRVASYALPAEVVRAFVEQHAPTPAEPTSGPSSE